MNVTRRQHYVWRYYLEGWAGRGSLAVVRKAGDAFVTKPANVAQERDFYRIPVLTLQDEEFARKMIDIPGANPMLVKLNMGWLDEFARASRLRRLLGARGAIDEELKKAIRDVEIQSEESFHAKIEGPTVRLLEDLRAGSGEFWNIDGDARHFAFFLSLQHLRTKAMRERVLSFKGGPIAGEFERTWPIIRIAMATNLGWSLYSERTRWHIRILSASGKLRLITGDQPVLNLLSLTGGHDDLAMYYPVSPQKAALLELREADSPIGSNNELTDAIVDHLNRRIIGGIHDQAFGSDLDYLRQLMCKP
ncbi:DUF4238 domain-containing protein [Xanthobacter sp. V7C-4]|uniref:DUF4238 domain-containing protein n=1 Tax=Xanthobacter autotrophicus (strain ATCC BAA-1158 / Py2) TaxID=78245 RepID=UPI003726C43A